MNAQHCKEGHVSPILPWNDRNLYVGQEDTVYSEDCTQRLYLYADMLLNMTEDNGSDSERTLTAGGHLDLGMYQQEGGTG
jgi:hypothetical protein